MAIDGVGIDEPLKISSSGSNDEAKIEHDGSDLLIDNDTGTTKFGNKTDYDLILTHGTSLQFQVDGANPNFYVHRVDAGLTGVFTVNPVAILIGSIGSATEVRFIINSVQRAFLNSSGILGNLPAYTNDLNGLTYRAIYMKDDGTIGYVSSTARNKTDIVDISDNYKYIYDLRVVNYLIKGGRGPVQAGLIAEEVEQVKPDMVSYETYAIQNGELTPIDRDVIENWKEFVEIPPNVQMKKTAQIKPDSLKDTIEEKEIDIIRVPETVQYNALIPPMLKAIQALKEEIEMLKTSSIAEFINKSNMKPREKKGLIKKLGIK